MIKELRLWNWMCFSGHHIVRFEPGAHAITARFDEDPKRSNGGGKCLPGDVPVYVPGRGPVPIRDFVKERGALLLGYVDGNIVPVRAIAHARVGRKKIVSVFVGGREERYATSHPVLTANGWKKAGRLQPGDAIATASRLPIAIERSAGVAPMEAFLVGCLLGDGVLSEKMNPKLCAIHKEKRVVFAEVFSKIFPSLVVRMSRGTVTMCGPDGKKGRRDLTATATFRRWASQIGLSSGTAAKKRVPSSITGGSDRSAASVLAGLWFTDGYVGNDKEVSYTSASFGLIDDVQMLLRRLGIAAATSTKFVDGKPYYTARVLVESWAKMVDVIAIPGRKGRALRALTKKRGLRRNTGCIPYEVWSKFPLKSVAKLPSGKLRSRMAWNSGHRDMAGEIFKSFGGPEEIVNRQIKWARVVRVEDAGVEECFDVEVDSDEHAYIAGRQFAIVHNSAILDAVKFVVTGIAPPRLEHDADAWISRGADEGNVVLVLENGAEIERSKRRGKPRQIRYRASGRGEAAQDEAAQAILDDLGFRDRDDFDRVAYFRQGFMDEFITMDPGARLAVVTSWLGLGIADRAAEHVERLLGERAAKVEHLERSIPVIDPFDASDVPAYRASASELKLKIKVLEDDIENDHRLQEARRIVETRATIVANGKRLKADVEAKGPAIEKAYAEAKANYERAREIERDAEKDVRVRETVARGAFDGRCPVVPLECPIKDKINKDRELAKTSYSEALAKLKAAKTKTAEVVTVFRGAEANHADLRSSLSILESERKRLRDMKDEYERAVELLGDDPKAKTTLDDVRAVRSMRDELADVERRITEADVRRQIVERDMQRAEVLKKELAVAERDLATAAAAARVITVAKRRVAERATAANEAAANDFLAGVGPALTLSLRWAREGKSPARRCAECGKAFPDTRKVKECQTCGAPRGLTVTERLDPILSDRSGAYDDLAGIAMQLPAAEAVLTSRASPWATCMLDEPMSKCDGANRKGLSLQLLRMMGRSVFRQLIVISHSPDTLDAYPNKIVVHVGRDGKRSISQ